VAASIAPRHQASPMNGMMGSPVMCEASIEPSCQRGRKPACSWKAMSEWIMSSYRCGTISACSWFWPR
jgi:hypothetical protein